MAVQYSNSSLPIIYGLDSVHGANYVYGAAMFPHVNNIKQYYKGSQWTYILFQNVGAAATFDVNLVKNGSGAIAARDTRLSGISWQFAPVLGIGVNPLWSRFYETVCYTSKKINNLSDEIII